MKSTIIAQSNSGATVVYLNPDGTIGFNSKAPIMSLGNLKWLRMQPWFKQGFLNRISDEVLMDVEPVELDIKKLPITERYLMVENHTDVVCVRTYYNRVFCHFSDTDDIAFVGNNRVIARSYGPYPVSVNTTDPVDKVIADFQAHAMVEQQKKEAREQQWLKEMHQPAKGWYVVTVDVMVSKVRGNDGIKTYSFRVLADNKMDAYNKIVNRIQDEGVKDSNVALVYGIKDSPQSALIEYVGIWNDNAEIEYGPVC